MTAAQFKALAKLLQIKQGASRLAAELVLVHGLRGIDAAQQAGITPQAASNVVQRCRRGLKLASIATGISLT